MMFRKSISISILRSIVCSFLLLCVLAAAAQRPQGSREPQHLSKDEQLRLRMKAIDDSIPWWRGFEVKADLIGAVQRAVSSYGQYEAGVRFNLKDKYFPVIEIGYGSADEDNVTTRTHYKTSAPYGKIGFDLNMMKNKHDIYRLYGGVRYAYTSYKFDIDHPDVTDPVWGNKGSFTLHDVQANYHWAEAVFGVDAKIAGPVHLGWTIRYMRRLFHDDGGYGNTWYVPGYGKQGSSHIWGTFEILFDF